MSWKLFLDDVRNPADNSWTIARTIDQAQDLIRQNGFPDVISFDHDVEEKRTGMDLAKWIVEQDLDGKINIPANFKFYVHSANPNGKRNIEGLLSNYLSTKFTTVEE